MGLFDKIIGGSEAVIFTKQEAVAAVLFLTVYADGEISDEEKELFIGTSNRMQLFRSQSAEEFNAMIAKIRACFDKQGFTPTLSLAAQSIPVELRDTTFALAADIIFADGSVGKDETLFLEAVQHALQITDEFAIKVVEVLQIKNRG